MRRTFDSAERSILSRACHRLEQELDYLNQDLSIPRRMKRFDKVLEKVGRLHQNYKRLSAQYEIEVVPMRLAETPLM